MQTTFLLCLLSPQRPRTPTRTLNNGIVTIRVNMLLNSTPRHLKPTTKLMIRTPHHNLIQHIPHHPRRKRKSKFLRPTLTLAIAHRTPSSSAQIPLARLHVQRNLDTVLAERVVTADERDGEDEGRLAD